MLLIILPTTLLRFLLNVYRSVVCLQAVHSEQTCVINILLSYAPYQCGRETSNFHNIYQHFIFHQEFLDCCDDATNRKLISYIQTRPLSIPHYAGQQRPRIHVGELNQDFSVPTPRRNQQYRHSRHPQRTQPH